MAIIGIVFAVAIIGRSTLYGCPVSKQKQLEKKYIPPRSFEVIPLVVCIKIEET